MTNLAAAGARRRSGPKSVLGPAPRERILEVTLALFEDPGIRATSMDDIAGALGISRPALYYYFSSKDDLLLEVVARQAESVLVAARRKLRGKGLERIAQAAHLGIVESLANPYVRMLIEGETTQTTPTILENDRILTIQREFWLPLLQQAQTDGDLRTDRPLAEIMEWIIFLQFSLAAAGAGFGLTEADIRHRLFTYLLPALRG